MCRLAADIGLAANDVGRTGGVVGREKLDRGGVGGTLGVVNALGGGRFVGIGSSLSDMPGDTTGMGREALPEPERDRDSYSSSVIETVMLALRGGMMGRTGAAPNTGLDAERCGTTNAAGGYCADVGVVLSDVARARSARVARGVTRGSSSSGSSFSVTVTVDAGSAFGTTISVGSSECSDSSSVSSSVSSVTSCPSIESGRCRSTLGGRSCFESGDGSFCSGGAHASSSCSCAMMGSTLADILGVIASDGPSVEPDDERKRPRLALLRLLTVLVDGEVPARGLMLTRGELFCPTTPATLGGTGVARFHSGEPAETARWRGVTADAGDKPDVLRRGVAPVLGTLAETERCFGAVGVAGSKDAFEAFGVAAPESRLVRLDSERAELDGLSVVSDTLRLMFRDDAEGRNVPALLGAEGLTGRGVACSRAILPGPLSAVGVSGDSLADGDEALARVDDEGVIVDSDLRGPTGLVPGVRSDLAEAAVDTEVREAALAIDIVRVRVGRAPSLPSPGTGSWSGSSAIVA